MSSFKKAVTITAILNTALFLGSFAAPVGFLVFFPLCLIECVIGAIMMIPSDAREVGKAILLTGLLFLLIGFSVCSTFYL